MGIAAYNRGSMVLIRKLREEAAETRLREDMIRAVTTEEEAHAWRREANLAAANAIERQGFLGSALIKEDRVSRARSAAVNRALGIWQEAADPFQRCSAAIDWAAAVYRLYDWGSGMFRFPILSQAPSTVKRRARKAA